METGLYFYRARWYSPELGRFISHDPKLYVDGMHLYEFVRGNPVNATDPMGLFQITPEFEEIVKTVTKTAPVATPLLAAPDPIVTKIAAGVLITGAVAYGVYKVAKHYMNQKDEDASKESAAIDTSKKTSVIIEKDGEQKVVQGTARELDDKKLVKAVAEIEEMNQTTSDATVNKKQDANTVKNEVEKEVSLEKEKPECDGSNWHHKSFLINTV